jgi:nucleotide-binding universal stress UspA family protein
MTIKHVLVHLDSQRNLAATAEAACSLATSSQAHVTGFYVIPHINIPTYAESRIPTDIVKVHDEAAEVVANDAGSEFARIAEKAGCKHDWISVKGYADRLIIERARYTDIVVMGQAQPTKKPSPHSVAVENHVIMGCARPVLMIPGKGVSGQLGNRVVVAWNGSRESVRALNDAMPFLEKAANVEVLAIDPGKDDGDLPGAEICQYLARHGVNAEAASVKSRGSTTDTLLEYARDNSANMVVMGAYGHSRLREFVLGGATYNMLQKSDVAILMSH